MVGRRAAVLKTNRRDKFKKYSGGFPCDSVVKNLPSNSGDTDSIPRRGTKIPHAVGLLSPHHNQRSLRATTRQTGVLQLEKACVLQRRPSAAKHMYVCMYIQEVDLTRADNGLNEVVRGEAMGRGQDDSGFWIRFKVGSVRSGTVVGMHEKG